MSLRATGSDACEPLRSTLPLAPPVVKVLSTSLVQEPSARVSTRPLLPGSETREFTAEHPSLCYGKGDLRFLPVHARGNPPVSADTAEYPSCGSACAVAAGLLQNAHGPRQLIREVAPLTWLL